MRRATADLPLHGGKDGHPFPVDRKRYDGNIAILQAAARRTRIDPNENDHALRRLAAYLRANGRTDRRSDRRSDAMLSA